MADAEEGGVLWATLGPAGGEPLVDDGLMDDGRTCCCDDSADCGAVGEGVPCVVALEAEEQEGEEEEAGRDDVGDLLQDEEDEEEDCPRWLVLLLYLFALPPPLLIQ